MEKQQLFQRKGSLQSTSTPSSYEYLQTRPFADPNSHTAASVDQLSTVDLQAQVDRANRFGHSFGRIMVQAPTKVAAFI